MINSIVSNYQFMIPGIRLATGAAGIRYQNRDDLLIIELKSGSQCAAVFTQNAFQAAPVIIARRHLAQGSPRALLINSGNANAGTGQAGIAAAKTCCEKLAGLLDCTPEQILPFSTGVIGEPLPITQITEILPDLITQLAPNNWPQAARAILTTDTVPKIFAHQYEIDGHNANLIGIAKGSGMICPNLATMLVFMATDAAVAPEILINCLQKSVAESFNSITVDGDTSTNDACVLIATGALGNQPIQDLTSSAGINLQLAVNLICNELATAIIRDGEGATKFVTIQIDNAINISEARQFAYTIAHSPLVKTALTASDPNWGRILAAVGRTGITDLAINQVQIFLGAVQVVRNGERASEYTEANGIAALTPEDIIIRIDLGRGQAQTRVLTCDLSETYVKINAAYRS